ncbi:MAG TPA: mechanosensitive ion channel domain-containing protein [Planktothrix sp.]|jgi:small-conductance mechanosensitive channel
MEPHIEHELGLAWNTVMKMVDGFFSLLPNLTVGFVVLVIFCWLGKVTKEVISNVGTKAKLDITLSRALGTVTSVVVTLVGLLTAAVIVIPHFSMANVIGGLGISSVAIGFAFKDILQNFFAGMLLLWQKPFGIGDRIKTKDYQGVVQDIRLRFTELKTDEGELALVPNGDIYTNAVIVSSRAHSHKVHLTMSIKDGGSLSETRQKIAKIITGIDGVTKEPAPKVYVADLNADAMNFDIYFWTEPKQADKLEITDRVTTALREGFFEAKAKPAPNQPLQKAS